MLKRTLKCDYYNVKFKKKKDTSLDLLYDLNSLKLCLPKIRRKHNGSFYIVKLWAALIFYCIYCCVIQIFCEELMSFYSKKSPYTHFFFLIRGSITNESPKKFLFEKWMRLGHSPILELMFCFQSPSHSSDLCSP